MYYFESSSTVNVLIKFAERNNIYVYESGVTKSGYNYIKAK